MIPLPTRFLIIAVLVAAFLIRLPGVSYGLPYHLLADEEANIHGALKMIELKTVLPVLHRADFDHILYYPPVLAYIYTAFFVPVIGAEYLISGHNLGELKDLLILDPSIFWYIARSLSIVFSLAGIYLVYKIAERLFSNKKIALIAAILYSTSFLEVSMANTAHHWTAGIFFSLLSSYIVLAGIADSTDKRFRMFILAGLVMGVSFGISFLVFYIPPLVLLIVHSSLKRKEKTGVTYFDAVKSVICFLTPFWLFALLILAIHPGAFSFQALHTGDIPPHSGEYVYNFIFYYIRALWNFETPLLVLSLCAVILLWRRKSPAFYLLIISAFIMTAIMYKTMYDNPRYLLPAISVMAILSAYACKEFISYFQIGKRRIVIYACASIFVIYLVAVFGRYEILLTRPDTRIMARNWIEGQISKDSTIITDSDRLRLEGTSASIITLEKIDKNALRGQDRILLKNPEYARRPFNVYPLFFLTGENRHGLISVALSRNDPNTYFVADDWILDKSYVEGLASRGILVKSFWGNVTRHDRHDLFIGGEKADPRYHLLELLYSIDYFGPNVSVYKLSLSDISK